MGLSPGVAPIVAKARLDKDPLFSKIPVPSSSTAIILVCNLTVSWASLFSGQVANVIFRNLLPDSQVCLSASPTAHSEQGFPVHKVTMFLYMQAHHSCVLHQAFDTQIEAKPVLLQTQSSCQFRQQVCPGAQGPRYLSAPPSTLPL